MFKKIKAFFNDLVTEAQEYKEEHEQNKHSQKFDTESLNVAEAYTPYEVLRIAHRSLCYTLAEEEYQHVSCGGSDKNLRELSHLKNSVASLIKNPKPRDRKRRAGNKNVDR